MTATWTLTAPPGSKAKIKDSKPLTVTEFTPTWSAPTRSTWSWRTQPAQAELASIHIHAGTYIGETAGNCKQCHPASAAECGEDRALHSIESDLIDNKRTPDVATHYAETCIRCHTTGYYPGAANGGYADAGGQGQLHPADLQGRSTPPARAARATSPPCPPTSRTWPTSSARTAMARPAEHVDNGAKMATSSTSGVCNQCHNGGGHHLKGTDLHQLQALRRQRRSAWTVPVGPAEQACVRCHSGAGYVSFLKNPKNPAAWDNSMQTVGCSTCHDPHSDANAWQLRIAGKPVADCPLTPRTWASRPPATNATTPAPSPADAVKGSYPHYSSAAELLNDTGGVDYGQKLPELAARHDGRPGARRQPGRGRGSRGRQVPLQQARRHHRPEARPVRDLPHVPDAHRRQGPGHGAATRSARTPSTRSARTARLDYTAACKTCHADIKDTSTSPPRPTTTATARSRASRTRSRACSASCGARSRQSGLKKIDTGYPYASVPKDASDKVKNAWYNYRVVYGVMWGEDEPGNEGAASAIHNFNRSVGLLQAAYKDLTGKDVPGATILK